MKKIFALLLSVVMICTIGFVNVSAASKTTNSVKTSISKVESKSKGFKVTWKTKSKIKGYQIQYSTSSKFKKVNSKYKTVTNSKTKSATIKKLKCNKKYYVRVRTYKVSKNKKIYSSWSKTKKVTTLKHKYTTSSSKAQTWKTCKYCKKKITTSLKLYTLTEHHSVKGFFHKVEENIDNAFELDVAVSLGLTKNKDNIYGYETEYWDEDSGSRIIFITVGKNNKLKKKIEKVGKRSKSIKVKDPKGLIAKNQVVYKTKLNKKNKNPKYGTVLRAIPSEEFINFEDWGWEASTDTFVWETYEAFEGDIRGRWVSVQKGMNSMSSKEFSEWLKYGKGMVDAPARPGKYEGECVKYTAWVWLDKKNSAPNSKWDTPKVGTVTTEDPRYTFEGGIYNWKRQTIVYKWCSDNSGSYWFNIMQSFNYDPDKEDPKDLWEKYADSYVETPKRNGKFVGEIIYKSAWVWLP